VTAGDLDAIPTAARSEHLRPEGGCLVRAFLHPRCLPAHEAAVQRCGQRDRVSFIDDKGEAVFVYQRLEGLETRHPTVVSAPEQGRAPGRQGSCAGPPRAGGSPCGADAARTSFLRKLLSRKGRAGAGTLRMALEILASREHHYGSTRSEAGHLLNPDADRDSAAAVFVEARAKTATTGSRYWRWPTRSLPLRPACGPGRRPGSWTPSWPCTG
jgi:hypothetical protein